MSRMRTYHRSHRYAVSPESSAWLRREAPFIMALIEAPGSRLTQCAKGITPAHAELEFPVQVEVGTFARLTTPVAALSGTVSLIGLTVGLVPLFAIAGVATGTALFLGRSRMEEWVLRLDLREENIDDIIANASISHDVPHRLLRMADYLVLTDQGKYLWDSDTFRSWEAQGSPARIMTYGLTATVDGEPRVGEPLRALQVM